MKHTSQDLLIGLIDSLRPTRWLYKASLIQFNDALGCSWFTWFSDYHSGVLETFLSRHSYAQILGDNLSNTFLFHVLLIGDHLNSQRTIATKHLPYPLNVDFSPACWKPTFLESTFHFPRSSLNLYYSKAREHDIVLFSYICWSI